MMKDSIGMKSGVKFLIDEENSTFLTDTLSWLQNTDIQHPVGQYIVSVCQGFHKEHGHGVKTLLYMIGALVQAATILKDRGVPLSCIIKHMDEGIEICFEEADRIKLPVKLHIGKEKKEEIKSDGTQNTEKQMKVEMSRESVSFRTASFDQHTERSFFDAPVAELEMKKKGAVKTDDKIHVGQDENGDEDDDDISWYFEQDDKSSEYTAVKPLTTVPLRRMGEEEVNFMSLKQNSDSDSDFDDCFDNVPTAIMAETVTDEMPVQRKTEGSGIDGEKRCENIVLNDRSDVPIQRNSSTSNRDKEKLVSEFKKEDENHREKSKFSEILAEKLKQVKLQDASIIKNQSRHFKTVTSAVDELQKSERKVPNNMDKFCGELFLRTSEGSRFKKGLEEGSAKNDAVVSHLKDVGVLEHVLKTKMQKSKETRLKYGILNSRHFKTIEDCLVSDSKPYPEGSSREAEIMSGRKETSKQTGLKDSIEDKNIVSEMTLREIWGNRNKTRQREDWEENEIDLREVIHGLCRSNDVLAELLYSAVIGQKESEMANSSAIFSVDRVTCLCLDGSLQRTPRLVRGWVVNAPIHGVAHIKHLENRRLSCILVNGDLRSTYHHKGHKDTVSATTVYRGEELVARVTAEEAWLKQLIQTFEEFSIDVVLCKGKIDDKAKYFFDSKSIVAIETVPFRSLLSLAVTNHVAMVTYVEEVSEDHILEDVRVRPLYEDWNQTYCCQYPVVIETKTEENLTIIYHHPCEVGRAMFEGDFHRYVHAVSTSLCSGWVLQGCGQTEKLCALKLQHIADQLDEEASLTETNMYKSTVLRQLADVMNDFYKTVQNNSGRFALKSETSYEVYEVHSYSNDKQNIKPQDKKTCISHVLVGEGTFSLPAVEQSGFPQPEMEESNNSLSKMEQFSQSNLDKGLIFCDTHFDALQTKMATWRVACETMATIMQTDMHIITGTESKEMLTMQQGIIQKKVIL